MKMWKTTKPGAFVKELEYFGGVLREYNKTQRTRIFKTAGSTRKGEDFKMDWRIETDPALKGYPMVVKLALDAAYLASSLKLQDLVRVQEAGADGTFNRQYASMIGEVTALGFGSMEHEGKKYVLYIGNEGNTMTFGESIADPPIKVYFPEDLDDGNSNEVDWFLLEELEAL